MGVQALAGSEETVWTVLAHEHKVYLECDSKGKITMVVDVDNTKKQNILIVHNYYQIPGGEDTVVANEKKMLEGYGHKVVQYNRRNSELKKMSNLQKLTLPLTTVFSMRTFKETKRLIRDEHIDIVHVHNTLNLISPSIYYAARVMKVPVVQTIHNFRLLCPGATFYRDGKICEDCVVKGLRYAVKYSCYRGSKLQTLACVISTKIHRITGIYRKINYICLTKFNKEKLLQLNSPEKRQIIDPMKVFVKPNFTFDTSSEIVEKEREYYLFIGRVEKIKGLDIILEAFAGLPNENLVIAGTGSLFEKYKKKATANVKFTGFLDKNELTQCLAKAKAVIVPSQWYETFGMIIVEAYAAHKPVIAGDIGNISLLVDEGKTGIHFKYNSVESLQNAIYRFKQMDSSELETNAYRKYKTEFTDQINYSILRSIYDSITNR